MRDGVPSLLQSFAAAGVRATFYLSMGPDRSGRAVLNVFRPGFLAKMRRTSAAQVYGLRTILSGTLLPSRPIATAFPDIARRIRDEGHETGVHAWDHRTWQDKLLRFPRSRVEAELDRGRQAYQAIYGSAPRTFAAPAWLSCDSALLHQETMALEFGSDCRGDEPFLPVVEGRRLTTPQVPSTIPTLDELLGFEFETADDYFDAVLARLDPEGWPVLTVHAEIEGGPHAESFRRFLAKAAAAGCRLLTLGELLAERRALGPLPGCAMEHAPVPGRHGVVSTQGARIELATEGTR
jgi:peptidoglycan/xylan/chitin deacetylase (PgdA/CDA1 family)